jgi:hypothetical protein
MVVKFMINNYLSVCICKRAEVGLERMKRENLYGEKYD